MSRIRHSPLIWMVGIVLAALAARGEAWAESPGRSPRQAAVERCRVDLASRLKVPLARVTLVSAVAEQFPDASLGLPRPDEMAAQVITPGWRVILDSPRGRHLYCVADGAPRYGGPVGKAVNRPAYHAIYLQRVAGDPNLNSNLVQVDLDGTHAEVVVQGVSSAHPQHNGALLATRRTSRSGHDLLYLAPRGDQKVVVLARSFYFRDAVLGEDGQRWAAITRPRVGQTWTVTLGDVRKPITVSDAPALPGGVVPKRIYWSGPNPVIEDGKAGWYYEMAGGTWNRLTSFIPPDRSPQLLNKSERLKVKGDTVDGHAVVKVMRVWFTGDEKIVATLRDCTLEGFSLTPDLRFALVSVRSGDTHRAFTVDMATGKVLKTVSEAASSAQLRMEASR